MHEDAAAGDIFIERHTDAAEEEVYMQHIYHYVVSVSTAISPSVPFYLVPVPLFPSLSAMYV